MQAVRAAVQGGDAAALPAALSTVADPQYKVGHVVSCSSNDGRGWRATPKSLPAAAAADGRHARSQLGRLAAGGALASMRPAHAPLQDVRTTVLAQVGLPAFFEGLVLQATSMPVVEALDQAYG